MSRWIQLINLSGIYTSPPFSIPIEADGVISKVSWDADTPEGSSIVVQTRYTTDGYNWSEWRNCTNNGQIPEVNEDMSLYNLQLVFRVLFNSSSYDTSPKFKNIAFDFEPVIVFNNDGDKICNPEIWITKVENGDFSIVNLSHNNDEFKFASLVNNETVYVNNETQDIQTSLAVTYRYKDFNDNYLSFPIGKNVLKINGKADIKFRYQFKFA
ncbi:hypothetical protein SAMN04487895_101769 [Paenibacillus sophorae]|uniref:Phage tail family protein n=1 Tax=Paenibacillus sophorae TaxID=1333845 RepID=A0A1H8H7M9_9BACL|nr:phage tail domain-containing protein [Paenibacillus sophorae]QWU14459.1 phage tail family protein [Paenibacillus sophorae]SEN51757.1 hypothetical protein SAMN04487895_101769 [Paenibacillus sophorae]